MHGKGSRQATTSASTSVSGIFVMLILGGIDSLWGPIIGAAFYVFVPHWLSGLESSCRDSDREYQQIFFGALLLLVMIVFPEGLGVVPAAAAAG